MLWIKAFHIIFMVTWFAGLFYLPRLYVYHAGTTDQSGLDRFCLMEKKLFYFIMTPGAVLTIVFGAWLVSDHPASWLQMGWLQIKLCLVFVLVCYHVYLGKLLRDFKRNRNRHSEMFYRWLNEVPAVFLVVIVILAVVKPVFRL